ncbi:MAG: hypothetical protein V3T86_09290 [Planctomycetota bacterium]
MKDLGTSKNVSAHSDGVHLNACEAAALLLSEAGCGQYCLALQKSSAGLRGGPHDFSRRMSPLLNAIAQVCKAKHATYRHAQMRRAYSATRDAFKSLAELNKTEALHDRAPPRPDDAEFEQRIRQRRERLHNRLDELTKELTLQMRKLAAELLLKTTAHARGLSGDLSPIHIAYCATANLLTQTGLLADWTKWVAKAGDDLALRQRLLSRVATFYAALAEARGIIPFPGHHWIYWVESPQPSALRVFNEHADWLARKLLSVIAPGQLSRMTDAPSKFKLDQKAIDPQKLDVGALVNVLNCRHGLDYSQLASDLMEEELRVLSHAPALRAEFSATPERTQGNSSIDGQPAPSEIKVLLYVLQHGRKKHDAHVLVGDKAVRWQLSDRQLDDLRQLARGKFALKVGDSTRKRAARLRDRFRSTGVEALLRSKNGTYRLSLPGMKLRMADVASTMSRERDARAIVRDFDRAAHGHDP